VSIKTPEYKGEFLFTKDEMRTRIEKLREKNKALRSQLKDAEEVMAGQDMLLKAYRTGNHRIADKALDRLSLADYRTKYGEVE
jgi:hypothetical protein